MTMDSISNLLFTYDSVRYVTIHARFAPAPAFTDARIQLTCVSHCAPMSRCPGVTFRLMQIMVTAPFDPACPAVDLAPWKLLGELFRKHDLRVFFGKVLLYIAGSITFQKTYQSYVRCSPHMAMHSNLVPNPHNLIAE